MSEQVWARKPGEATSSSDPKQKKMIEVIELYVQSHPGSQIIVMNDQDDILYLGPYDEKKGIVPAEIDVAVYDGNDYVFLPEHLAQEAATAYLKYVDCMGRIYTYLEGGE